METHSVTVVVATVTTDDLGNSTESDAPTQVDRLAWAPEGIRESSSADAPRVIGEATLYGKLPFLLDADAVVQHESPCCDGQTFPFGEWQVVGGARGWGAGRYAVPIKRTN